VVLLKQHGKEVKAMTNVKLLEEKIRLSGLKKRFIAEKIGVTPNTLSALLNNKAEFKTSHICAICQVLNIQDDAEIKAIFFAENGA
jgi:transcriptional regulator with XRE-family HTH domain